jgi:hypothetical protein
MMMPSAFTAKTGSSRSPTRLIACSRCHRWAHNSCTGTDSDDTEGRPHLSCVHILNISDFSVFLFFINSCIFKDMYVLK